MAGTGFDSNATELADAIRLIIGRIALGLVPVNETILLSENLRIQEFYGARLAKYWDLQDIGPASGELAHLHIGSDDPKVIGYEFGTREHFIRTSQDGRPILRFDWTDGLSYFKWVHHPGTKPHNLQGDVLTSFDDECQTQWEEALGALLALD